MPQIERDWVDQILILDGGSTDGTVEYARDQGYEVVIQERPGIRFAYMDALPHIRGDVILTFSPDGNSVASLVPAILDKLAEGHDMVIASRYLAGATSDDDDFVTAFGNWLFTRTVNLLHGGSYTGQIEFLPVAYRTKHALETSNLIFDVGVRCARSP